MKIGIVTVWFSENYGSFWQAKSLGDFLSKSSDVYYINTINSKSSHSYKYLFSVIIRNLMKRNFKDVPNIYSKYRLFDKRLKEFEIIEGDKVDDLDLLVFGSDTLWDMQSEYFRESSSIFWGLNHNTKKISYAPSIANTTKQDLEKMGFIRSALESFSKISVRDKYSSQIIGDFTSKKIYKVCDPTLLFDKNHYVKLLSPIKDNRFILIYLFDNISKDESLRIIDYAKQNELQIIALGRKVSWADKTVFPDPFEFLGYFHNAEKVITNTFHGTIFSLIFEKSFISFGVNKKKIEYLLEDYDLINRFVKTGNSLDTLLNTDIDYKKINLLKSKYRDLSQDFIMKSIFEDRNKYE